MIKLKYWILIIAVIAIIVFSFSALLKTVIIKHTGDKVIALVSKIPFECDKYNHISVLINNEEYEVNISKENCRAVKYSIGQKITLLKHDKYKELVWPESKPEIVPFIFIALLFFSYLSVKKKCNK